MRKMLIAAALVAGLAVPTIAEAQRGQQDRGDWNWRQRNTTTFANRGQCQRALVAERREARREAGRRGYNDSRFNQRWRLSCQQVRVRNRVMYRIR